jgi:hypothetical protein
MAIQIVMDRTVDTASTCGFAFQKTKAKNLRTFVGRCLTSALRLLCLFFLGFRLFGRFLWRFLG